MNCYICDCSDIYTFLKLDAYSIRKCNNCGHATTSPALNDDELSSLYNKTYFDSHYDEIEPSNSAFKRRIKQELHRLKFIRKYKQKGYLLDIGCGKGYFLYSCKENYDCIGYDVTTENKRFIEDQLNLDFVSGDLNSINISHKFDIITFWHSLEHFRDPYVSLQKISNHLSDDGIIVIDVPNHESIDGRMFYKDWPGWSVPFHFHHFTRNSLTLLLKKVNIEIILEKTYHSEHVKKILKKYLFTRVFARPIAKLFEGNSIAVVCKTV
jgi:2-polyprenyl-3-methyl-5-hydroxy-6-metoxy-1,4-benzoquinol methylase